MLNSSKLNLALQYIIAISGCIIALYISIEHTTHFFANHNYFFSPFADDILDNAHFSYPIALGKQSYLHVFDPFVDHRVAIERIQEIIDFLFTNGVQLLHPYRISLLLWLNFLVFSRFVIFSNESLSLPLKLFLSSVYLILLFSAMSINNYVSTMQITWPIIYLFSLFVFLSVNRYCQIVNQKSSTYKAFFYMFLTVICLNIVLYTFNIGLILWPIVFVILIKQTHFQRHQFIWITIALLNYYCYLEYNWVISNFTSYTNHASFLDIPGKLVEIFSCFSRILSIPFTASAFDHITIVSIFIGLFATFFCLLSLGILLKSKDLSTSSLVFFSYFLFTLLSVIIISMTRSKYVKSTHMEWRFLTVGLSFIFCIFMSLYLVPFSRFKIYFHTLLSIAIFSWLIYLFIPIDKKISGDTYDLGFFNQVFISEATGIPIDDHFLQASKIYQSSGSIDLHNIINSENKSHHKGPYSFYASRYMNHPITALALYNIHLDNSTIDIVYDYRYQKSPGILLNVKLKSDNGLIDNDWQILFTNSEGMIIGFAISAPYFQPLWEVITHHSTASYLWRGAINTTFIQQNTKVIAYAVKEGQPIQYQLGEMVIPSPLQSQNDPTWVWQKTQHFGTK